MLFERLHLHEFGYIVNISNLKKPVSNNSKKDIRVVILNVSADPIDKNQII